MRSSIFTLFMALLVVTGGMQEPAKAAAEHSAQRVLIIAPLADIGAAAVFADTIAAAGRPRPSIVAIKDYAPLIDVRVFDGFIMLGIDSHSPPKVSFVQDMLDVDKPILWVGHHADLLGTEDLTDIGLALSKPSTGKYRLDSETQSATVKVVRKITVANPATAVLHLKRSIFGATVSGASVGAARSGRLTYAAFIPEFVPGSFGMAALTQLALDAFGLPSEPAPSQPDFTSRISQARSDDFATAVHLPVYISETRGALLGYDGDALHENLVRIRDAGAEWVVIQRIFYQNGLFATEIFADPQRTATLASLANVVADAHKLGLKVRLVPVVNLTEKSRRPGDWRGLIEPANPYVGWAPYLWWARYREILLEDAAFARDNGVEALDIGAEMSTLIFEDDHWQSLAADVRGVAGYRGLIGYQVNYHILTEITWSDALDYLAVAAYWPLSETPHPELEDLVAAWENVWDEIGPWVRAHPELRVEIGEIGYVAQPYTSVYPFSGSPQLFDPELDLEPELDVSEQLTCYLALESFLANRPEIRGVAIFASTANDVEPTSLGYSPFAKPAAEVVRRILQR